MPAGSGRSAGKEKRIIWFVVTALETKTAHRSIEAARRPLIHFSRVISSQSVRHMQGKAIPTRLNYCKSNRSYREV